MLQRGGPPYAALFAAARVVVARRVSIRALAVLLITAVAIPAGAVVVSRAERSARLAAFTTTVSATTQGVLPLSHPVAAALPPGKPVPRPKPMTVVQPSRRNALIVGINHARGSKPLQGSVTDAMNLKNALLRYGFPSKNITVLTEGAATRNNILAGIHSLAARTPASGMAVFAIATHSRRRGEMKLVASDGALIGAHELASALGAIKAKTWVALATCYAEAFGLPGVVGHNRIATFASSANEMSYQIGEAGSYMVINMVKKAMIEGYAPRSIEDSFAFAKAELQRTHPYNVPVIRDDIPGDVALGPVTWQLHKQAARRPTASGSDQQSFKTSTEQSPPQPQPTPAPSDDGGRRSMVGVCGRYEYRCSNGSG